ncbi:collagen alpha-1(I) chain-like [Cervus elaphus]|uniref:collagen alpha-1(I) chain-like n=1 Tax=Cervus elaphus TaxID=9860 RepID=UPI001CC2AD54|nr:collagen alpha-1(I) chain-like [Cervus elaphus]
MGLKAAAALGRSVLAPGAESADAVETQGPGPSRTPTSQLAGERREAQGLRTEDGSAWGPPPPELPVGREPHTSRRSPMCRGRACGQRPRVQAGASVRRPASCGRIGKDEPWAVAPPRCLALRARAHAGITPGPLWPRGRRVRAQSQPCVGGRLREHASSHGHCPHGESCIRTGLSAEPLGAGAVGVSAASASGSRGWRGELRVLARVTGRQKPRGQAQTLGASLEPSRSLSLPDAAVSPLPAPPGPASACWWTSDQTAAQSGKRLPPLRCAPRKGPSPGSAPGRPCRASASSPVKWGRAAGRAGAVPRAAARGRPWPLRRLRAGIALDLLLFITPARPAAPVNTFLQRVIHRPADSWSRPARCAPGAGPGGGRLRGGGGLRERGAGGPPEDGPEGTSRRGPDGVEGGSRAQPRHRQGDEQASEEQIPAFQDTFPRASPRGRERPCCLPAPQPLQSGNLSVKNDPKTTHRLEHKDVWCGVYNREESRPITASKEALGGDDPRAGNSPGEMLILGPSERAGVHPSPHGELGVRRPHARTAQARAARGGAGRWGRRGGLPLPAPSAWTVLISLCDGVRREEGPNRGLGGAASQPAGLAPEMSLGFIRTERGLWAPEILAHSGRREKQKPEREKGFASWLQPQEGPGPGGRGSDEPLGPCGHAVRSPSSHLEAAGPAGQRVGRWLAGAPETTGQPAPPQEPGLHRPGAAPASSLRLGSGCEGRRTSILGEGWPQVRGALAAAVTPPMDDREPQAGSGGWGQWVVHLSACRGERS